MRLGVPLILAALAGGCLNIEGPWGVSDWPTAPSTPAYLLLKGASPSLGQQLNPLGAVSFTLEYGIGSAGTGNAHDIQVEIAAPPGASYTLPRPCVAGLYAVSGGRAACDVPLAGDWTQAAHPMVFTFRLIRRDGGFLGTAYVGEVVATLVPVAYAN